MIKVVVNGIGGRMGRLIAQTIIEDSQLELLAGIEGDNSPCIGKRVKESLNLNSEALIYKNIEDIKEDNFTIVDFTFPEVTLNLLEKIKDKNVKLVIGTTGFSEEELEKIKEISKNIPIVLDYNMSLGVNLLAKLVEYAASKLSLDYEVEITEIHHRYKKDSPSGTAIKLAEAVLRGRGEKEKPFVYGRYGKGLSRDYKEIGIHAIRGGDVVGEHDVMFITEGERIIISHKAHSRMAFVKGVIAAIKFLSDKNNGFYRMYDVLGL